LTVPIAPLLIQIHPADTVAVATRSLSPGEVVQLGEVRIIVHEEIQAGHKVALRAMATGDAVLKYGFPIGVATADVPAGGLVHTHTMRTGLSGEETYAYRPTPPTLRPVHAPGMFMGYRRAKGRVGTRNEIWILNTVGCVNRAAERIARAANTRFGPEGEGAVDGVFAFSHPYGCSQLGDDLQYTQRILARLMEHPNAGGVVVIGLGCENNRLAGVLAEAQGANRARIRSFSAQAVEDEIEEGLAAVAELVDIVRHDTRELCPVSDLVLGMKCGGSDGFSGVTANPLVGRVSEWIVGAGGRALLSEVPEMFGAENALLSRCAASPVFDDAAAMLNRFKRYFLDHGQPVYENPSPGNKDGGLSSLEEKSLGAIQKGGLAPVTRVVPYATAIPATDTAGLTLVEAPGNDGVSSTAMIAAGATVLLFTTGRGTPLGFPVPTLKIATNPELARRKPHWIDFSAGQLLEGVSQEDAAQALVDLILQVASGTRTRNEENDVREMSIWKHGVTL